MATSQLPFALAWFAAVLLLTEQPAHGYTNSGKRFVLAFMENEVLRMFKGKSQEVRLLLSSTDATAHVNVTVPRHPEISPQYVTLPPMSTAVVDLPAKLRAKVGLKENKGVLVESDVGIAVHGINAEVLSTDAFLALPTTVLGSRYICVTYLGFPEVLVVATEPETEVMVKIRGVDVTVIYQGARHNRSHPVTATLDAFQTLHFTTHKSWEDLTGSEVIANKPVAVFSGNRKTSIPTAKGSRDHLVEQMTPLNQWGSSFVLLATPRRQTPDLFRVVAGHGNTSVSVAGMPSFLLKEVGDYKDVTPKNRQFRKLKSNLPVMLVMFEQTSHKSETTGDPAMTLLMPNTHFLSEVPVSSLPPIWRRRFIDGMVVIGHRNALPRVTKEGKEVILQETEWKPVLGSSDLAVLNLPMKPMASYITQEGKGMMVYVFGGVRLESYAYAAGYTIPMDVEANCVPIEQKPGDGVDNDCDGSVDEEVKDGKDNDGDGLIDEDCAENKIHNPIQEECRGKMLTENAQCVNDSAECLGGYKGNGHFLCVPQETQCACVCFGDPHLNTYTGQRLMLPVPCPYRLASERGTHCSYSVWVSSALNDQRPSLSVLDTVHWQFTDVDNFTLSGFVNRTAVFLTSGKKVLLPSSKYLSHFKVRFDIDSYGFYRMSSQECGLTMRFRQPVLTLARHRQSVTSSSEGVSACWRCDESQALPVRDDLAFGLLTLHNGQEASGHCRQLADAASRCHSNALETAAQRCRPLVDPQGPTSRCDVSASAVVQSLSACLADVCKGGNRWCEILKSTFSSCPLEKISCI